MSTSSAAKYQISTARISASTGMTVFEQLRMATDVLRQEAKSIQELACLLYTSPSPRDGLLSRMPSSA